MASKNISLREDAYLLLKREKREGESFSDVIARLAEEQQGTWARLETYAGIWKDSDGEKSKLL